MNPKTRKERFVVVGGCAAGMSAASKAKRLNPKLDVLVFEKTPHVSYSACGIPYFIADLVRDASELVTLTPEDFRVQRGIDVCTRHEVVGIKPVQRLVTVVDLETRKEVCVGYEKLVISVGGRPSRPALPGMDLKNVFTIQTLEDGIHIKQFIDENHPGQVVIVGGGYIAMEMAEACCVRGLDVIILEKRAQILDGFETDIVEQVAAELKANKVTVETSVVIERLHGNSSGKVTSVAFDDKSVQAELVLVCAGLRPSTQLAAEAGVRTGNSGAIAVDWKLQTNVSNIYAAGDCVEVRNHVSGKPDYIPLGPTANKQGRVVGENVGGGTAKFPGVVGTSVFKTFGLAVARTGLECERARSLGFDADVVTVDAPARAGYFSRQQKIRVSVIFDKRSRRLLGAQIVGPDGVSKRIDIFAAALTNRMTLNQMAYLDLSYAPPFAPVWDPVLVAVNVARGKLR
ncbi:MAG: NADH oxidase [Caldithrix sp.]|nr:MAG: NADH oxidase [Caldithrix sp.]